MPNVFDTASPVPTAGEVFAILTLFSPEQVVNFGRLCYNILQGY